LQAENVHPATQTADGEGPTKAVQAGDLHPGILRPAPQDASQAMISQSLSLGANPEGFTVICSMLEIVSQPSHQRRKDLSAR
jgi:hypothetical protein